MKNLLMCFFFFSLFSISYSQDTTKIESDTNKWLNHRFGLYTSTFSATGLSYQYQFENGFSIRHSFYLEDGTFNRFENYGIDLQYNLVKSNILRFYSLIGVGLATYKVYIDYGSSYNYGSGLGLEVMIWPRCAFVFELGISRKLGDETFESILGSHGTVQTIYTVTKINKLQVGAGIGIFIAM